LFLFILYHQVTMRFLLVYIILLSLIFAITPNSISAQEYGDYGDNGQSSQSVSYGDSSSSRTDGYTDYGDGGVNYGNSEGGPPGESYGDTGGFDGGYGNDNNGSSGNGDSGYSGNDSGYSGDDSGYAGDSGYNGDSGYTPPPPPPPPSGSITTSPYPCVTTSSTCAITVSWSSTNASGVRVSRDSNATWASGSNSSKGDSISSNVRYQLYGYPAGGGTESQLGDTRASVIILSPPTLGVNSCSGSKTSVSLSWSHNESSFNYELLRDDGASEVSLAGDINNTSYTDTTGVSNTPYRYRLRLNGQGNSYTSDYTPYQTTKNCAPPNIDSITMSCPDNHMISSSSTNIAPSPSSSSTSSSNVGKLLRARTFNGTSQYLFSSRGVELDNRSFSISTWAKRNASGASHWIASQGPANITNQGFHMGFRSNNTFTCAFWNNDLNTTSTYTDTDYHLWTCTFDNSSKSRKIYKDGVVVASDTATSSFLGKTGLFNIGRYGGNSSGYFNGIIDEIGIWGKALTSSDITSLYNGGAGRGYDETNALFSTSSTLLGYYGLNETSGANVFTSGNVNSIPTANVRYSTSSPNISSYSLSRVEEIVNASSTPSPPKFDPDTSGNLKTSLVSYWKMDESTGSRSDSISTNHLTDNSISSVGGKISNAAHFVKSSATNGNGLYIFDNASLHSGDIDFTFAAWVKMNAYTTGAVIGKGDAGARREYRLVFDGNSKHFQFVVNTSTGEKVVSTPVNSVTTGNWYFVVAYHNKSTDQIGVSLNNGTPVITSTGGAAPLVFDGWFTIGDFRDVSGYRLDGDVDEVGFWKRILTSQEKTDLYNGATGNSYSSQSTSASSISSPISLGSTTFTNYLDKAVTQNKYYAYQVSSTGAGGTSSPSGWEWSSEPAPLCEAEPPTVYFIGDEKKCYTPSTFTSEVFLSEAYDNPATGASGVNQVTYRLQNTLDPNRFQEVTAQNIPVDTSSYRYQFNLAELSSSGGVNQNYRLYVKASDKAGNTSLYTSSTPREFSVSTSCLSPWIQTTRGDVHTNTIIDTPGGPE
jgi:hypothetical protein